jgi:hypothetical protein
MEKTTIQEKLILKQLAQNLCGGFKMSEEMLSNILIGGWEVAKEHVQETDEYKRLEKINRLGQYTSEDDTEEAYDKLMLALADGNGNLSADEFVNMWEPLEWTYTVRSLIEEL